MATETLMCVGTKKPHKWTRESTRGRKPTLCPKHKQEPVKKAAEKPVQPRSSVATSPTTKPAPKRATETLTCLTGGHSWERQSTRGRKPTHCPKHTTKVLITVPVVAEDAPLAEHPIVAGKTETLACSHGHEWIRLTVRGRKPTLCPEHAAPKAPKREQGTESVTPAQAESDSDFKTQFPELWEYRQQRDAANAIRWAKERKAKERIDNLEMMLKSSGLHLSQNKELIAA